MPTIACINATSRTLTYLISQALSSPDPPHVKAIVRSEKRFLSKLPPSLLTAAGKPPSALSIHEYSDYTDPIPLISILKDVETIYIALGINDNKPTRLNQDVLQSIVSALAASKATAAGSRSPTKLVLLSAFPVTPYQLSRLADGNVSMMERFLHNTLLANQYDDLSRAQAFLERQSPWLDWTVVSPGGIGDDISPEEEDPSLATYNLAIQDPISGGVEAHDFISYSRLARAMLEIGRTEAFVGKYVSPVPTGRKSQMGWEAMAVQREVFGNFFRTQFMPSVVRTVGFAAVCACVGYWVARGEGRVAWLKW